MPQARIVEPAAPWIIRPAITPPPVLESAISTHDATKSPRPSRKKRRRPKTSPKDPEVTITAAPTSMYPVTAHWSCATGAPVSSLIAGSSMVTAEVFAFTTSADTQAAASTPIPALRATGGSSAAACALVKPGE